ncbi:MAG: diaminopimelate decarboxylase family protein [Candidatus Limivicinus sp.]|jgi:diaminopimelate decarboxylase
MECNFVPLIGAEKEIPSPSYVFDDLALREKISQIRALMPECKAVCFAMKANPFLIGIEDMVVDRFEVCSPGEYEICSQRGIDPEKIIVSGVNKTRESMNRILGLSGGKGIYTIESLQHFEILEAAASSMNLQIKVLIRLSSGNQFGVDRGHFLEILRKVQASSHLFFRGIHYFSGTQKKMKRIRKELAMLEQFGLQLKQEFRLNSLELEYGPGLSVAYFEDDKIPSSTEQLTELNDALGSLAAFQTIGIEMGRFIASSCGFFLTKVIDIKNTEGSNYVILDGGIHQLHYFGQMMGMKIPAIRQIPEREGTESYILCGSLCTVNDVMVRDAALHTLQVGDYLLFGICGAYSMTEGSALFLSRELPAVYERTEDGTYRCLRNVSESYPLNTSQN